MPRKEMIRILVDRLRPRGISQKQSPIDLWFHHHPTQWSEF